MKAALQGDDLPQKSADLIKGLQNTGAEVVFVKYSQVVDLVGQEKAETLCIMCNNLAQNSRGRIRTNSRIPKSKRIETDALGMFFRTDLIEAIKQEQGKEFITPSTAEGKPEPNPVLLAQAKKAKHIPLTDKDKEALS